MLSTATNTKNNLKLKHLDNILGESSDSDSGNNSDSDSDAPPQPIKNKPSKNRNVPKPNKKREKQEKRIELTANEIAKLMVQAVDSGK